MKKLLIIATLCAPVLGCDSHPASRQDKKTESAAETALKDQREFGKDLGHDFRKGVSDISKDLNDVDRSQAEFTAKKDVRVSILRGIHALELTELTAIRGYTQSTAFTAAGEAAVNAKLVDVDTALDTTGKLIEALPTATAEEWAGRDDEVAAAMTQLSVTLQDVYVAMRDAPRQEPATAS